MPREVPLEVMHRVYDEVKTPFKHGIVLHPPADGMVDCPSVFRANNKWYMVYVCIVGKVGYETYLASSDDLVQWKTEGKILSHQKEGAWDQWQSDGGLALVDPLWGGSAELGTRDGKSWISYIGGALQGYEPDPLSLGIAWSENPTEPKEWTRLPDNPVLGPRDADVRAFEAKTLYKSNILRDPGKQYTGHEFVMFYNGKQAGPVGTERIGMAVSDDLISWKRFGDGPVIDNGPRGISGDPQLVRMKQFDNGQDLWVMHYFGHVWQPKAFDTFACSYDLVNWTRWTGPHTVEPSEPWDNTFAHKPWVLKWNDVVYHFYCAVGDQGRCIALATSKDLKH